MTKQNRVFNRNIFKLINVLPTWYKISVYITNEIIFQNNNYYNKEGNIYPNEVLIYTLRLRKPLYKKNIVIFFFCIAKMYYVSNLIITE